MENRANVFARPEFIEGQNQIVATLGLLPALINLIPSVAQQGCSERFFSPEIENPFPAHQAAKKPIVCQRGRIHGAVQALYHKLFRCWQAFPVILTSVSMFNTSGASIDPQPPRKKEAGSLLAYVRMRRIDHSVKNVFVFPVILIALSLEPHRINPIHLPIGL